MSRSTLWKFPLPHAEGRHAIQATVGAEPLSVGLDFGGKACVWVQCFPGASGHFFDIAIRWTGSSLDTPDERHWRFLGTVAAKDVGLILHVWARR